MMADRDNVQPDDILPQARLRDFPDNLDPKDVLSALLSASNECIKILDLEGRLVFMSEGGQRVMDVSDFGKMAQCPWPDLWQGEGQSAAREAVGRARQGYASRFLGYADTALGNSKFWDVQVVPVGGSPGKPTHLLSMSRDISDLKSADIEIAKLLADAKQNENRFRMLADSMPQMVWSTLQDGYHDYYNARWYDFTGMLPGSTDGEGWNDLFHPDDQARAWTMWRQSLATGDLYEIEYRLRHHSGQYRWVLGRALPIYDANGTITRWYGTCTDIHDAKRISENLALLSHELSHRIKNIFAIINGLIGLSARRYPESKQFASDIQDRLAALGRAHDFARPHSDESRPITGDTTLKALLREILKPYPALDEKRIEFKGDAIAIDDRSATPFALIFHELATNATKYGALSVAEGYVSVSASISDGNCQIDWVETGGPEIHQEPAKTGFGTKLSTISAENQLGGVIERNWKQTGLHVSIRCPINSLHRS